MKCAKRIRIEPRSGGSLRSPGFSRRNTFPKSAHKRRRRDSRSIQLKMLFVVVGWSREVTARLDGFRAYGALGRFVFGFPRLKPEAGKLPPLTRLQTHLHRGAAFEPLCILFVGMGRA
jgi:hypothetical protein